MGWVCDIDISCGARKGERSEAGRSESNERRRAGGKYRCPCGLHEDPSHFPDRLLAPAMPICNPTNLKSLVNKGDRLLGLDVGTRTIGMALSDTTLLLATPLDTIRRTRFRDDAKRLLQEIARHQLGGIALGPPLSLDGGEGPRVQGVRQFAPNLLEQADLALPFWDVGHSAPAVEPEVI